MWGLLHKVVRSNCFIKIYHNVFLWFLFHLKHSTYSTYKNPKNNIITYPNVIPYYIQKSFLKIKKLLL